MAQYSPEDLRAMREGLVASPSQGTQAYASQLEAYRQAIGEPAQKSYTQQSTPTWESDANGVLVQKNTSFLQGGDLSIPGTSSLGSSPGIVSSAEPTLQEETDRIRAEENARKEAGQKMISGRYADLMDAQREKGVKEVGGLQSRLGEARGLGESSSRNLFIKTVEAENQKYINSLEKDRQAALQSLDFESVGRADDRIDKMREYQFKLRTQSNAEKQQMLENQKAAQAATEAAQAKKIEDIVGSRADELNSIGTKPYLTLPNGQRISPEDPNYDAYASQPGVVKEDINYALDKLAKETGVDRNALETQYRASVTSEKPQANVTLSPGETFYDPNTKETYTVPQKPIDDKPIIEKSGSKLLQWDALTKTWNEVVSGKTTEVSVSPPSSTIAPEGKKPSVVEQDNFNNPDYVASLQISDITKSIISGYGEVKSLTPTDKSKVQAELYRVGFDPKTSILKKLDALASAYKGMSSQAKGIIEGRLSPNFVTGGGPEAAAFDSAKAVLTRIVARLNDVGMLSDQDVETYNKAMPSRSDRNDAIVESKVQGLKDVIGITKQGARWTAPDGTQLEFPSQEKLDAFKKAQGLK